MDSQGSELETMMIKLKAVVEGTPFRESLAALSITQLHAMVNLAEIGDPDLDTCLIAMAETTISVMTKFKDTMLVNSSGVQH